jgi:hypothetical protein
MKFLHLISAFLKKEYFDKKPEDISFLFLTDFTELGLWDSLMMRVKKQESIQEILKLKYY